MTISISYADLQRYTGMGYQTVKRRLEGAGLKPVGYGDGPGKAILWDSKEALEAIYAPLAAQGEGLDPAQERALLDKARREAQEMKNAELEGKLISADEAVEIWARQILAAKTKILGIKSKCAPIVHDLIDDIEDRETVLSAIDDRCREALTELSEGE